jgi:methyl-accepting chemotaxis protein
VASASTELSRFSSKMAGGASEQSSQILQIASAMEAKDSDFDGVRAMMKRLYNVEYR